MSEGLDVRLSKLEQANLNLIQLELEKRMLGIKNERVGIRFVGEINGNLRDMEGENNSKIESVLNENGYEIEEDTVLFRNCLRLGSK